MIGKKYGVTLRIIIFIQLVAFNSGLFLNFSRNGIFFRGRG